MFLSDLLIFSRKKLFSSERRSIDVVVCFVYIYTVFPKFVLFSLALFRYCLIEAQIFYLCGKNGPEKPNLVAK